MRRGANGNLRVLLVAAAAGSLLGGCATVSTLDGPDRPDEDIAILEGYWRYYLLALRVVEIRRVDDRPVVATRARLSPGRHQVALRVGTILGEAGLMTDCAFEEDFSPGRRYRVRAFDDSAIEEDVRLEVAVHHAQAVTTRTIACRRSAR